MQDEKKLLYLNKNAQALMFSVKSYAESSDVTQEIISKIKQPRKMTNGAITTANIEKAFPSK